MAQDPIRIQPQSKFPWPLAALIVAGLILAVFVYLLPRGTPRQAGGPVAGQVPNQPFGGELQIAHITVQPDPTGAQAYVAGTIENTGGKAINEITVDAEFLDGDGKIVQKETKQVE